MKLKPYLSFIFLIALSNYAFSARISVEITNLTHGSYFTPILITAHSEGTHLFEVGSPASSALQTMAEGGNIAPLKAVADSINAVSVENPAEGLLAPATKTSTNTFDTRSNNYLSITAMILPSNDGFIGLDAWKIPSKKGTYTVYLNAYDAGTEANDEVVNGGGESGVPGIPANPGMNGGQNATGVTTTENNTNVHIHRGVVGDTDAEGGKSDLDSRIHRWLNPVAKAVIKVQ